MISKFFEVQLNDMRALVKWLIEKDEKKDLLLTSKLRSRKSVPILKRKCKRKLTAAMLDFLKSQETLTAWQGKSLTERTALFLSLIHI